MIRDKQIIINRFHRPSIIGSLPHRLRMISPIFGVDKPQVVWFLTTYGQNRDSFQSLRSEILYVFFSLSLVQGLELSKSFFISLFENSGPG